MLNRAGRVKVQLLNRQHHALMQVISYEAIFANHIAKVRIKTPTFAPIMRRALFHIEGVPNPRAIKFVLENGILTDEPFEYRSYADAATSPLARKLLLFRYVESVLIHRNYITVLKSPTDSPDWEEALPELRMLIQGHLDANEPILFIGANTLVHSTSEGAVLELIRDILDRHVRPAAQEDGGDIFFESYENGVLNLTMHGSCIGCPYVTQTIKEGVEPLIRSIAPEVRRVTATANNLH
ncbi:MAG: NifU family protein [Bacteroidetes bacterium]|nr:MAG: NifU family protein [Bacteroidota bacterium]